jgi:ABC-2 family transporter protein
LEDFKAV